ncbi:MAG: DUF1285 domain-containing protein [Pseudomonadota bacterium]
MSQKDDQHVDVSGALSGLLSRAEALGGGAAPVHLWDPPDCGPIPMRIAADGTWFYAGTPIVRDRLVRLFASILRREAGGEFVLVTPVEKVGIVVEDAPFQAVEMAREADERGGKSEPVLVFRTNMGDVVRAGPDHPLRFHVSAPTEGLVPYVTVRGGLEARLTRAVAMDLSDDLVEGGPGWGVWSGSMFFAVPEG